MTPHYSDEHATVYHGDCLDVLPTLPDESIDSVVTDPPYELTAGKKGGTGPASINLNSPAGRARTSVGQGGFMGKSWDATGIGFDPAVWRECLRVLKPGGHLVAFGGTRTYHRLACAIEDAGFEIRDSLHWIYGSGFPKSLDASKAIDRAAGAEREVIGSKITGNAKQRTSKTGEFADGKHGGTQVVDLTAPATDAAQQWQGFGTALKPAHEPIVLARKPLSGTVAANVLQHGTGALNIDGCRIGTSEDTARKPAFVRSDSSAPFGAGVAMGGNGSPAGRWPPNVIFDEAQAAECDRQSGVSGGGSRKEAVARPRNNGIELGATDQRGSAANSPDNYGDQGGASRFFPVFKYSAKAPGHERPNVDGVQHATVKPLDLMRWLVRLVTPPRVSTLVCSNCGKDLFGVRRDVPAKSDAADDVRDSVPSTQGGTRPEDTANPMPDMRQDADRREGEKILQYGVSGDRATETAPMQGLWDDVPSEPTDTADVLAQVRVGGSETATEGMRELSEPVPGTGITDSVLWTEVRGGGVRSGEAEGANDDGAGVHHVVRTRASDGDEARLPTGTPEGGSRNGGTDVVVRRSGASPQRHQDGQSPGESRGTDQVRARPDTETTTEANRMPTLRREDQNLGSCASCGGDLVSAMLPGTILDPFAGSGTTAEACIHEHRRCVTIEREAEYLPLIVARLRKPMQVGFDFG